MIKCPAEKMSITYHDEAEKEFIKKTTQEIEAKVGGDYYVTHVKEMIWQVRPAIKHIKITGTVKQ